MQANNIPFVSELQNSGWIDSASLYQTVDYFDHQYNKAVKYAWSARTVVDLTVLFILTDYQQIAPSMEGIVMVHDDKMMLTECLLKSGLVKRLVCTDALRKYGREKAIEWASSAYGAQSLRDATTRLLQDSSNFGPWIDWTIGSKALTTHLKVHRSLVDEHALKAVGAALGKSKREIADLKQRASDLTFVESIRSYSQGAEAEDVIAGYMCSSLVRGRAHVQMALAVGNQIMPHPFRESVLFENTAANKATPTLLKVSNTVERLAQFVVAIAAQEKTTARRLQTWVDNIDKIRRELRVSEAHPLTEQYTPKLLEDTVATILKRSGLMFGSHSIHATVEYAYGVGVAVLASVAVDSAGLIPMLGHAPEYAAAAGLATALAQRRISERSAERITQLTQKNLLDSGAGILRRNWVY